MAFCLLRQEQSAKMEIRYIAIKLKCLSSKTQQDVFMHWRLIKSIGVKVSPILFAKVSVLVSAILLAQSIGIVIGNTFCRYR